MFKKITIIMFTFSLMGLMSGCESTMKGMGEDIEQMGKTIKESMGSDKDSDKGSDKDADAKK